MDDQEFSSLFGNLHDYSNSELIKNEENESLLNLLKTLTNHLKQAHNRYEKAFKLKYNYISSLLMGIHRPFCDLAN